MSTPPQRVAVVTGAGRGIGESIARRLSADGLAVVVSDIDAGSAEAVARSIGDAGGTATWHVADVADRDACFGLVAAAREAFGTIDVMVANAGIVQVKTVLEITPADLDRMLAINLGGVLWSVQSASEAMIEQGGGGKIIAAASIAGHWGFDHLAHYSASKFGVRGLVQAAAKELAQHRITVNAYCPGIVGTPMWDQIDESLGAYLGKAKGETLAEYSMRAVLGRTQTPEDVAGFVSYLASRDSDFMTGQAVAVDGGIVMI